MTLMDLYNSIKIVGDENLRALRTIAKNHRPLDVMVSPDGKLLTWTEGSGAAYTVQETDGDKTFAIEVGAHDGGTAFSLDNKLLGVAHTVWFPNAEGAGESQVKLFDLSGKLVRSLEKSGAGYLTPVFRPDGKMLAVGNLNHETRLFEVATGKLLHTLNKQSTRDIAFSPDGKTLAAAYVDGTVALCDVATGKSLYSIVSGCKEVYSVDWEGGSARRGGDGLEVPQDRPLGVGENDEGEGASDTEDCLASPVHRGRHRTRQFECFR
jgi:WD40 repeat protein